MSETESNTPKYKKVAPSPKGGEEAKETHTMVRRGSIRANVFSQIILGVVLFGIINYLGYRHFKQWDCTYDKQFSLGEASQQMLAALDTKVDVAVVAKKGTTEQRDLWQMAEIYHNQGAGKLRITMVDPFTDREAFDALRADAATFRIALDQVGGQGIFIRTSAEPLAKAATASGESTLANPTAKAGKNAAQFLPMASLYRYINDQDGRPVPSAFLGEPALTGAIMAISSGEKPNIHIVFEKGKPRVTALGNAYEILSDMAARQNMGVHPLFLSQVPELPPTADCVAIIGPTDDFLPREIDMLRKFYNTPRKSILLMLNAEKDFTTPELDKFLTSLGITPQNDRVLRTYGTDAGPERVFVVDAECDPESVVSASLKGSQTKLPGASRSLKLNAEAETLVAQGITQKPLLIALNGFWGEKNYLESAPVAGPEDNKPPLYLGATLERGASKDPLVGTNSSRLLVLGNSSILDPDTLNETNHDLVHASLQWMLRRENFMGINPRPKRLFKVRMDEGQQQKVFLSTVVILPTLVGLLGLFIWGTRHNK